MSNRLANFTLFLTRVSLGGLFLYSGIIKILNPAWSAAAYLKAATTFPEFYLKLASPEFLPYINFLNQWGLVLIGASLLVGWQVRWSALFGAALMLLYYFPILKFPLVGEHGYIVDEHIIYAAILLYLAFNHAGTIWGLDRHWVQ